MEYLTITGPVVRNPDPNPTDTFYVEIECPECGTITKEINRNYRDMNMYHVGEDLRQAHAKLHIDAQAGTMAKNFIKYLRRD